jgi:hypothetical protein
MHRRRPRRHTRTHCASATHARDNDDDEHVRIIFDDDDDDGRARGVRAAPQRNVILCYARDRTRGTGAGNDGARRFRARARGYGGSDDGDER